MLKWQDEMQNPFIKCHTFMRICQIRFSYWVPSPSEHLMGLPTGELIQSQRPSTMEQSLDCGLMSSHTSASLGLRVNCSLHLVLFFVLKAILYPNVSNYAAKRRLMSSTLCHVYTLDICNRNVKH